VRDALRASPLRAAAAALLVRGQSDARCLLRHAAWRLRLAPPLASHLLAVCGGGRGTAFALVLGLGSELHPASAPAAAAAAAAASSTSPAHDAAAHLAEPASAGWYHGLCAAVVVAVAAARAGRCCRARCRCCRQLARGGAAGCGWLCGAADAAAAARYEGTPAHAAAAREGQRLLRLHAGRLDGGAAGGCSLLDAEGPSSAEALGLGPESAGEDGGGGGGRGGRGGGGRGGGGGGVFPEPPRGVARGPAARRGGGRRGGSEWRRLLRQVGGVRGASEDEMSEEEREEGEEEGGKRGAPQPMAEAEEAPPPSMRQVWRDMARGAGAQGAESAPPTSERGAAWCELVACGGTGAVSSEAGGTGWSGGTGSAASEPEHEWYSLMEPGGGTHR